MALVPSNNDYNERYIILQKATLRPEKVVFYTQFVKRQINEKTQKALFTHDEKKDLIAKGIFIGALPSLNKHNFNISYKASNRIREKVTWLYHLAKSQVITTHNGILLNGFKMSFITLTLPSMQNHTTDILTKECLNQFITECSAKFGLKNYVWRLEFQKNGNAHYHIATDTFIEFWQCRKIWNRILNKLGYIDAYASKLSKYNFASYYKEFHKPKTEDYAILRGRYNHGVATHWQEPNTVDCRNVSNHKNIAYYISKYITKNPDDKVNPIIAERDKEHSNIRLWFCSRSLSKMERIEIFMDNLCDHANNIFHNMKDAKSYIHEYCTVKYFNTADQINSVKRSLWSLFREYANSKSYYNTA